MPYTAWKTWSAFEVLTAADMNTYTRDNGRWLSHSATGGAPCCRVFNSTSITGIGSGAAITFDSESFDVGGMHSTVTSTERLTVPTGGGGLYMLGGMARLQAAYDGSGNGEVGLQIVVNGTTTIGVTRVVNEFATSRTWYVNVTAVWRMSAGDYATLQVGYLNQTNVDVIAGTNYSPTFWAIWMGE
jgi:hypothetical protein